MKSFTPNPQHLSLLTPFLLFVSFLLFLLVSLSVPIIHSIYLFTITSHFKELGVSVTGNARIGVWGYCVSEVDLS